MKAITLDHLLHALEHRRKTVGGAATVILSLTGSGIEDVNVGRRAVQVGGEGDARYVELRVSHPVVRGERLTKLDNAITELLDSADDAGCTEDMIVVSRSALRKLSKASGADSTPRWL